MRKASALLILILLFASCREEIIAPGNFAGNINEPIQLNNRNSFTFLINADNFSMNTSVPASFNTSASRISITLLDRESGFVFVGVRDSENAERYRHTISSDTNNFTEVIDGFIPKTIQIRTQTLSGKLKIQLTNAF
ncbi:MAG TPA: hypothetical protein VH917_03970 [Ignavibacteriaceae bacterium]|jgi:hypothetical protein